jgi:alpha-mannosidase
VVDTVKYAQDGSGDIVIRMYEGKGMHTECKVHFGFDAKRVSVTNMLEQDLVGVDVDANEIALPFRAFEIITVRITV